MTNPNPSEQAVPPEEVTISEQDGVRYLHLGTPWVQGAMRIREPQFVALEYVQRMLAALLWLPSASLGEGLAVQLGLGAGALTRFTSQTLRMHTLAVELNPRVIAANRRWFRLGTEGARLAVLEGDALAWVNEPSHAGRVRLLHVDLYDADAACPVLDDESFYAACRRCLDAPGVMAVNLFGRRASLAQSLEHIARVFGAECVWHLQATREGNTVVVATRMPPDEATFSREELAARADNLESRFGRLGLPARKWLRMVRPYSPAA
jgi:spermidine synthase